MQMSGRRRHARFLLVHPVEGQVLVRSPVTIESREEREIVLLCVEACRPDEVVSVEIPGSQSRSLGARVAESRPVVMEDGAILHRVRLVTSGTRARAAGVAGGVL